MNGLIAHLESHLGPIDAGWSKLPDGSDCPFQIVRFLEGPIAGVTTLSTIGLSNALLPSPVSSKDIRHEFLFVARSGQEKAAPAVMQRVGIMAISHRRPLLRGEVVGPTGALIEDSALTYHYASVPVYHPDTLASCHLDGGDVAMVWLVPISEAEANFVRDHGWSAFEDKLVEKDPDLLDLCRPSVV
jgi:Suppressor of fused protein (SUFU)